MNPNKAFRLENHGLVAAIMLLWDAKKDTAEMASILHRREFEVERALHIGLELRRSGK